MTLIKARLEVVSPGIDEQVLNACGLKSKLRSPEFEDFVCKQDIVCVSETKPSSFDDVNIVDEYKMFSKTRKHFLHSRMELLCW